MIMIRSIVRPEKVDDVLAALMEAGFPGVTKMSVVGRGKQRGIKICSDALQANKWSGTNAVSDAVVDGHRCVANDLRARR